MAKRLRCKLGLHHWHYKLERVGWWFYAVGTCYYCPKEHVHLCNSIKEWFAFGNNWADRLLHERRGEPYDKASGLE